MRKSKFTPYKKSACFAFSALMISGCQALTQSQSAPSPSTPTTPQAITSNDLQKNAPVSPTISPDLRLISRIGELSAQPLIEKGCGLFLWASLPERTLVFYTDTQKSSGLMMLDDREAQLNRVEETGLSYAGLAGDQTFTGPNLNVKLTFTAEQTKGFTGGAIVRQATLRMKDNEGWEVVMPVAGLIGCNSN